MAVSKSVRVFGSHRSATIEWTNNSSSSDFVETSRTDTLLDGSRSWTTAFELTTETQTTYSRAEGRRDLTPGWNLSVSLKCDPDDGEILSPDQSFAWGPDLSGSEQGAGGIGGLAIYLDDDNELGGGSGMIGPMFPVYDGNGNITRLYSTALDSNDVPIRKAEWRYGPFGESRGQTGPQAARFPFRWSTKFTDNETGLVYYGYRYYSASLGRWISRDPIAEYAGPSLVAFLTNDPVAMVDALGLRPPPTFDPPPGYPGVGDLGMKEGEWAIRAGQKLLEVACDVGCLCGVPCSRRQCKLEVKELIQLLIDSWNRHYGRGKFPPGVKDPVAGYFCWDWAAIFEDAASSKKWKCLFHRIGQADGPQAPSGGRYIHYFLKVWACNESPQTLVNFDDGFTIEGGGGECSHPGPYPSPGNPGWVEKPVPILWPPPQPVQPIIQPKDDPFPWRWCIDEAWGFACRRQFPFWN